MATLVYYADPMCSWCWGFAPIIERLAGEYADRATLEVVPGGLRPFTEEPLAPGAADEILHHWHAVHEASGQPFDFGFFEAHPGFTYDTEPSCRAVMAAKHVDAGRSLAVLAAIQRRYYAEGQDPTNPATLQAAADDAGLDGAALIEAADTEAARKATVEGFQLSRSMGVRGYPTLDFWPAEGRPVRLTIGYRPYDAVAAALDRALALPPT